MKDNRKTIQILTILTIIFTIMGGSLAYWNWTSNEAQRTTITFGVGPTGECSADGGGDISSEDVFIVPTTCTDSEYKEENPDALPRVINREVTVNASRPDGGSLKLGLWLNIDNLSEGLKDSENFKYVLSKSSDSCTEGVVSSGTFQGLTTGNSVNLLQNKIYTGINSETYYLYIWLDNNVNGNPSSEMNQTFSFSLGGECTDDLSGPEPNAPVLDEKMIPVTIDNNGKAYTVSTDDASWYNYSAKKWANVVLVDDTNRETYLSNLEDNIEVSEDDILAYYVWIPRYKYKVWTTTLGSTPQAIDILFENATDNIEVATTVGQYMTHPSFVVNDDTIAGFWVGKFETSGTSTTPYVLPNAYAYPNTNISNSSSVYGLSSTSDLHSIKNKEWGAIAYLSHSIYGINGDVAKNSMYVSADEYDEEGYLESLTVYSITGCGTGTGCQSEYGSGISSYQQSTTGNITGVFDMVGGLVDSVSGGRYESLEDSNTDESGIVTCDFSLSLCTLETCGGHAMFETRGWYDSFYGGYDCEVIDLDAVYSVYRGKNSIFDASYDDDGSYYNDWFGRDIGGPASRSVIIS